VITNYKQSPYLSLWRQFTIICQLLVTQKVPFLCAPFRIFLIRNELVGSVRLFDLCTTLIAEI
jgi:hypothetical protein